MGTPPRAKKIPSVQLKSPGVTSRSMKPTPLVMGRTGCDDVSEGKGLLNF